MKRTTALTAFVAAGVLLLAGCGSSAGTATPASDTAGSATNQSVETSAADGSSADGSSADGSSADGTDGSSAATDGSSADGTDGSSAESSDSAGTDESSADGSSDEATTVGSNGDLDATTTKWFSTFCEGMAPVAGLKDIQSKIDPSDLKKTFQVLADAMSKMGGAFTTAASSLKDQPAPTFEGGDAFAKKIVTTFGELGPKFTKLGEQFAKADPTDPASMSQMSSLGTDLADAAKPLQEMQSLKIDSATQAAIGEIPACKKMAG